MRCIIFMLFLSNVLYGQNNKTIYGNFVIRNQVYQYKCEKDKSLYRFSVSSLEPKNIFQGYDSDDISTTIAYLDSIHKIDTSKMDSLQKIEAEIKKKYAENVVTYFFAIQGILNSKEKMVKNKESIDSLISKAKELKITEAHVPELLESYKVFIYRNHNYNESTEKITQDLRIHEFRFNFEHAVNELSDVKKIGTDSMHFIADEVFYSIKAKMEFNDDEPITAYLILKRKYIDIDFNAGESTKNIVKCKIDNVSVEFDEGTIKNIFIDVIPVNSEYNAIYGNNTVRFRNNMPISVSGKFDVDQFHDHKIFISNSKELLTLLKRHNSNNKEDEINNQSHILLSDILDLKIIAENDKEDYSPANCVVKLTETDAVIQLKKEKRSKILTAMAFTDVVGLNQNNQNGLVQIEVKRRLNLYTKKLPGFLCMGNSGTTHTGWINYFTPVFALNKIETNNKYLSLNKSNIDTVASFQDSTNHFNVNQLNVYQYRIFSLQGNLNICNWNAPNWKLSFHFNYFANYGSTLVADSVEINNHQIINTVNRNTDRIGTFMHGPDCFVEYKPESRMGLLVGASYGFQYMLSDKYNPSKKYENGVLKIYATGFLKTNDESKLFLRFAYNQTLYSRGNNFYQLQLGYLIDLFTMAK